MNRMKNWKLQEFKLALHGFQLPSTGCIKKVYTWKIFANLTSAHNWTSSTKIIYTSSLFWLESVLRKDTSKMAYAQKLITKRVFYATFLI